MRKGKWTMEIGKHRIVRYNRNVRKQPVGKRPFPFGGRSAIVIRQDMSPHVQALLQ